MNETDLPNLDAPPVGGEGLPAHPADLDPALNGHAEGEMCDHDPVNADEPQASDPCPEEKENPVNAAARQSLDRICLRQRECRKLELEWVQINESAKAAKKQWEASVEKLSRIIESEGEPTLFNQHVADAVHDGEIIDADFMTEPATEDDSWKAVPLTDLGITTLAAKLAEAGISTVGELAAYTEPNASGYAKRLSDIKGIGGKKCELVEEALTKFWSTRKSVFEPAKVDQPTADLPNEQPAAWQGEDS